MFIGINTVSANQLVTVVSDHIPTELRLMLAHIEKIEKDPKQLTQVIDELQIIEKNLNKIEKRNTYFFIKTEIYKSLLKFSQEQNKQQFQITSIFLAEIQDKLTNNKLLYSEYSFWLISSILTDFESYLKDNKLEQAYSIKGISQAQAIEIKKMNRKIDFLAPLLQLFDQNNPADFEKVLSQNALTTLQVIAANSSYMQMHTNNLLDESTPKTFFQINEIKQNRPPINTVETAETIKSDDDLSEASEAIDQINPSPEIQWVPAQN